MRIVVQFSRNFFPLEISIKFRLLTISGRQRNGQKKKTAQSHRPKWSIGCTSLHFPLFFGKMKKKISSGGFFFLQEKKKKPIFFFFCAAAGGVWNTPERRDRRGGGLFRSSILLCPLFFFLFQNFSVSVKLKDSFF